MIHDGPEAGFSRFCDFATILGILFECCLGPRMKKPVFVKLVCRSFSRVMKTRFSHGSIAEIIVLQKSKFHDFGVDFVVCFECLGHNFHVLWKQAWNSSILMAISGGARTKAPTPVVVILRLAGSLTSTY